MDVIFDHDVSLQAYPWLKKVIKNNNKNKRSSSSTILVIWASDADNEEGYACVGHVRNLCPPLSFAVTLKLLLKKEEVLNETKQEQTTVF